MTTKIDLHIHSDYSDGSDSVEIIFKKAKALGLEFISICDHDDIGAMCLAIEQSEKTGIKFVNGVELEVVYKNHLYPGNHILHLLGYGFDHENEELKKILEQNKKHRRQRIPKIIENVNNMIKDAITDSDLDKTLKEIKGALGRPHLADILIYKKIVKSRDKAFDKYLNPCNVPNKEISLEKGSEIIRNANGKVVLSHPGAKKYSLLKIVSGVNKQKKIISNNMAEQEKIIISIRHLLDGLECFYISHEDKVAEQYVEIAEKYGWIITGGGDHHGGDFETIGHVDVPDYVRGYF